MNFLNNFDEIYVIIAISYAFGSIPFGYLITKFFLKKDIRKIGSGNIGATNVLRTGNKIIGYSTLLLDVLKAILPLIIIKIYMNEFLFIASLSVFLGHVFPIWLKFKGGKGVATYVGILCCINLYLGIGFGFFLIITLIIFRRSSKRARKRKKLADEKKRARMAVQQNTAEVLLEDMYLPPPGTDWETAGGCGEDPWEDPYVDPAEVYMQGRKSR